MVVNCATSSNCPFQSTMITATVTDMDSDTEYEADDVVLNKVTTTG